ncbi:hypothetical protein A3848_27185 [Paenibacillus sp. P32E]|nr:hypothetical protein A3848_27185 [Paenibacillus sp. P32E]
MFDKQNWRAFSSISPLLIISKLDTVKLAEVFRNFSVGMFVPMLFIEHRGSDGRALDAYVESHLDIRSRFFDEDARVGAVFDGVAGYTARLWALPLLFSQ